jgi:iron complex outermembrane receptor protein
VGAEFRYENTAPLGGMSNRFTLGVQPAYEHMDNRQFVNEGGRHGAATRDELDKVINLGIYAENALSLTDRLTAVAGFRIDRSRRSVDDDFLSNGDQSAERVYRAVTPRFGLLYEVAGMGGAVFANASRTVEPPLLLEMSSFGNPGGFIDLDAQRAWQYELGARGRRDALTWEVSLYDIELRDEILNINVLPFEGAQFTVPTYRNAPRTRHYGIEAGLGANVASGLFAHGAMRDHLTARMSYTYGRFTYVDDSTFSGNDIPGAPRHYLMAELRYAHPSGVTVTPHVEWVPRAFYVNSDNSVENGAWSTLGVRAEWTIPSSGVTAFAEARNLFNRTYSASVQVDNAAGRFYEPAEPRSVLAGLRWSR